MEPAYGGARTAAVIGAGSWGTAVAGMLGAQADVRLWARDPALAACIQRTRENPTYLAGIGLPASVEATADVRAACEGADVVVMAVPSHGFRSVLEAAAGGIPRGAAIVSLTKGLEQHTLLRMTEIVREVLPDTDASRVGVLTGPNLAREVAEGQPTASVIAMEDPRVAGELQHLFMTSTFRVYTNPDVVGCELAGALKNVVAIAAGMAAGLGYGDNTMASLITRGLAELARLGVRLGGDPLTFSGLAGMGDLIATCISAKSRNRHVGFELGRGLPLDAVLAEMNMVAEGVKTTAAVVELAARAGVEVPIAALVAAVLYERVSPAELLPGLMLREAKPELHGMR
ncbi:MAG: NAD(P)H-dependent glycerol-3-phosphate dehydrogenase [Acidimicrobiia bacterium]